MTIGADGGGRTHTMFPSKDFESFMSAYSITSANITKSIAFGGEHSSTTCDRLKSHEVYQSHHQRRISHLLPQNIKPPYWWWDVIPVGDRRWRWGELDKTFVDPRSLILMGPMAYWGPARPHIMPRMLTAWRAMYYRNCIQNPYTYRFLLR